MGCTATLTAGTGSSTAIKCCQVCDSGDLEPVLFLGFLPPVNRMQKTGVPPTAQPSFPAQVLQCPKCHLAQLGLIVDPHILFPKDYPYTSSTTRILRENFAQLAEECGEIIGLKADDLVVDIGSNDGNLLSHFKERCQVQGITPEDIGKLAVEKGIPTLLSYFDRDAVKKVIADRGKAKLVTATNVFAHIEDVHEVTRHILELLTHDGVFISESHYLASLIETNQYDTVYHEHLRYYSLHSLKYLLEHHGLELLRAKKIPTHGGSIRVYAARPGLYPKHESVALLLAEEERTIMRLETLKDFRHRVLLSKLQLHSLLLDIKAREQHVFGIGAPSRGSTLVNYVGIDDGMVDAVMEVPGSHKIGNYVPGTLIPIEDESRLYDEQPEYALLFSWHICDELAPKLKAKGYRGDFIVPLPEPRILRNSEVS